MGEAVMVYKKWNILMATITGKFPMHRSFLKPKVDG